MTTRDLVVLVALALAAWGHLLVHNTLGAADAWTQVDELFPPAWRSPPDFAGAALLTLGAVGVLGAALG